MQIYLYNDISVFPVHTLMPGLFMTRHVIFVCDVSMSIGHPTENQKDWVGAGWNELLEKWVNYDNSLLHYLHSLALKYSPPKEFFRNQRVWGKISLQNVNRKSEQHFHFLLRSRYFQNTRPDQFSGVFVQYWLFLLVNWILWGSASYFMFLITYIILLLVRMAVVKE